MTRHADTVDTITRYGQPNASGSNGSCQRQTVTTQNVHGIDWGLTFAEDDVSIVEAAQGSLPPAGSGSGHEEDSYGREGGRRERMKH